MVSFIETFSGLRINPLNPDPLQICIEDIAHALSMQCRFTGHTKVFYSVAEHCIRVAKFLEENNTLRYHAKRLALWGLLHDASEAYLHDIASPVKHQFQFSEYRKAEEVLEKMIFEKFGLSGQVPPLVKYVDRVMVATEGRDLMPSKDGLRFGEETDMKEPMQEVIVPISQKRAEKEYLRLFKKWSM